MPIQRIESLTYGVADLVAGVRFFEDSGLEKLEEGESGATFGTSTRQFVHLRRMDDPGLPPAPESGPTLREVVWGVDTKETLEAIGAELSRDREVRATSDGVLHSRDEIGFALGFGVANPAPAASPEPRYNNYVHSRRVNERVAKRPRPRPIRIGHVVYLIQPATGEKASAFYLDRLGFRLSDHSERVGNFMRVQGLADHHSLLLMWIRQKPVRFDHAALEVPGFDDVLASNAYMTQRGWTAGMGPGRQALGSHVYWHYINPCGGELEFFADMDRFDDSWPPQTWTESPGNVWVIGEEPGAWMRKQGTVAEGGGAAPKPGPG